MRQFQICQKINSFENVFGVGYSWKDLWEIHMDVQSSSVKYCVILIFWLSFKF